MEFAGLGMARPISKFLLFLLLLIIIPLSSSDQSFVNNNRGRSENIIIAKQGVVAADDGRCSRIGRDILREGGHAVDAAVAVALCLGVVSPASSGIGGGAFMLVRSSDGKSQAFDMRETAPNKASLVKILIPKNFYYLFLLNG